MKSTRFVVRAKRFGGNLFQLRYRETIITLATLSMLAVTVGLFPGWDGVTEGLQTELRPVDLALVLLVGATAGAVKGLVGFGFATIATSVFALMIDPLVAVVVLSVPSWALNLYQIGETHAGLEMLRREWPLILLSLIGSAIGVFALSQVTLGSHLVFAIGLLILGYVAFQVTRGFVTVRKAANPLVRGGMGFGTGLVMAVTNIGILFPIYVHTFERNKEQYVGLMGLFFLFILTERIVQMSLMGLMTPYRFWLGSAISLVTLLGLGVGSYLRRLAIDERRFNWLIVVILSVIGLNILRKTVPDLFL